MKNKKNAVGKGRGKGLNRQKRATTDLKKRKKRRQNRQMRDRAAPEMGKTTV